YLGVGRVVGGIPAALADIMQPECEDGFGLGHRLLPACHHSIVAGWRREGQRHGDGVASVSCLASMTASTAMAPADGESGAKPPVLAPSATRRRVIRQAQ